MSVARAGPSICVLPMHVCLLVSFYIRASLSTVFYLCLYHEAFEREIMKP